MRHILYLAMCIAFALVGTLPAAAFDVITAPENVNAVNLTGVVDIVPGDAGKVQLSTAAADTAAGRDFEVTTRAVYGIWGLVPLRTPDVGDALAGQLVGGERIANVRVHVRSRWSDVLISALTLGIIVPRAVTYEGTVVGP